MPIRATGRVVRNRWPTMGKAIRDRQVERRRKAAADFRDSAKRRAPVDTGELRDGIVVVEQGDQTSVVESQAQHSAPVNNGHHTRSGSWVPPQPFWDATLEEFRATYPDYFRGLL